MIFLLKEKKDKLVGQVRVQNLEHRRQQLRQLQQQNKIQQNSFQHILPRSIGCIVRGFKIGVTKWFCQYTDIYKVWQRNY
jgi:hypothetical protein